MTVILPATLESRDGFSKERRPDFSYKLNPGQYGLDMTFPDKMDIDESRMAVWVPFADGHRRDGVGDLLEVGGINTERHRANPVILFDHGKKVELPVGMAEDPDTKEYKVVIDSVSKIAKAQAFFYQGKGLTSVDRGQEYDHAVFCEQLFDMIAKRIIRGGSIGYQVVRAVDLSPDYQTGIPKGMHLIQTLMLEASVVVMPANMDTVRKALDMPQICGKSLSPTLRKCLEPYVPERKAQFGWEKKSHPIDQQQKPVEDKEPDKRDWTTDETVEFKKKSAKDVRERLRAYRERDERGVNRTTPTIRVSSPVLTTEIKQMSEDGDKLYPVDDGPEIGMSHTEMGSIIAAVVGMVLAGWGITKAVQWAIQKHKGPITPQDESKIEEAARAEVARKSNGTKGYGRAMGQGALRGAAIGLAATAPVGMIQGAMSGYDMAHAINDDVQEAAESSDVTRDYQINRHMLAGTGAGIVGLGFGAVGAGVGAAIGAGHGLVAEYLREKAEQRQSRGQKGYARAIGRGALRGAIIGGGVGLAGGGVVGGINAGQGAYATAQGRNEQIDEINARTRSNNEVSKKRNARAAEIGDTSPMWDEDIAEHPKVSVSEEVVKASPRGALRGALLAGGIGATLGAAHGAVSGAYQQYRQNKKDKKSMRPIIVGRKGYGRAMIGGAIAGGLAGAGYGAYKLGTEEYRRGKDEYDEAERDVQIHNHTMIDLNHRRRNEYDSEDFRKLGLSSAEAPMLPTQRGISESDEKLPFRRGVGGGVAGAMIGGTLGAITGGTAGAIRQYRQNRKQAQKALNRPPMAGFNWRQEEGQRLGNVLLPAAIASVIGIVAAGAGLTYAVTHVVRKMRQQGEQVTPEMEQVIADEAQSKLAAMGKSQGAFLQKAYHSIRYGCKDLEGTDTAVLEATDELLASTDGDVDEALLILHNTVEGIESGELEGDQSVLDFAGEVALALDEVDTGDVSTKGYGRSMVRGAIAGGLAGAGFGGVAGMYEGEQVGVDEANANRMQRDAGYSHIRKKVGKYGLGGALIGGGIGAITGAGLGALNHKIDKVNEQRISEFQQAYDRQEDERVRRIVNEARNTKQD